MIYAADDKLAPIFLTDVTDDVMADTELVKQLDHVVGILL